MRLTGIILVITILCALPASGATKTTKKAADAEASQHFKQAENALASGNTDLAISEYREALRLKPTSSYTKDRLVAALSKKVDALEKELAATRIELAEKTLALDIQQQQSNRKTVVKVTKAPIDTVNTNSVVDSAGQDQYGRSAHLVVTKCWLTKALAPKPVSVYPEPRPAPPIQVLNGEIQNVSAQQVDGIVVHVQFYDASGKPCDGSAVSLNPIPAGGKSSFAAETDKEVADYKILLIEGR